VSAAGSQELAKANGAALAPAAGAPSATGMITPPQFMQGFDGIAASAFPEDARKVLAEPVDEAAVEVKPDGIVFLPGVWYRRQLTKAFGAGAWALAPRQPARVMGDLVIYPGALYILGRFVSEAVGECFYRPGNSNMSYASCLEGARTDALTRCCKDLGMGSELWDAAWRDRWLAKYTDKTWDKEARNGRGAYKFTRKDAKNRQVQQVDLMAGAGGEAPKEAGTAASAAPAASGDNGEAASKEQLEAIAAELKKLAWKKQATQIWMRATFDVATLGALTATQADTMHALLMAWGKPPYPKLLAGFVAAGKAKDIDAADGSAS
jgi:hypothetical protein